MKRYKVTWIEHHEMDITAADHENPAEVAHLEMDERSATYKTSHIEYIDCLGDVEPDDLDIAHTAAEDKLLEDK